MVLTTTETNEVGKARWRTVREDRQWSRTLDEVIIVLAKRSPLSAQSVHSQRLELRKHCGDRLNGDKPHIPQQQTDDDLEAGLEVGVLTRSKGELWRIDQDWWGKLDNESHAAVAAFGDCEPGK